MGEGERCCGDLALRSGRSDLADELAVSNVKAIGAVGAKEVVTSSSHCRQSFDVWYLKGDDGLPPARHVVEVLADALHRGDLVLSGEYAKRVAYHDPCYLGRYAKIYEPPRDLLRAVPGLELVELPRNRERALCCGGGGGGAFRETAQDERHALLRIDEALESNVEVLATACPLCLLMLEDAVRVRGVEEELQIVDVGEVLLAAVETTR